jgi:hypothetical protein
MSTNSKEVLEFSQFWQLAAAGIFQHPFEM